MTHLVIVESPTKAKTISRFLGSDFIVKSSFGHIRDLPKSKLGIDTEHDFEPHYLVPAKAKKNVAELKKDVTKADVVILATDPDREGEAIAWHLQQALGLDGESKKGPKVERVVFHEITKHAIEDALKHPHGIDQHLVDAQQARRVLDRLVGYKLSPFLWKKVARGLSAGRVQSVAVRIVVEREREIEAFKPQEYWSITAALRADGKTFEAQLTQHNDKDIDKLDVKDEAHAKKILAELNGADYVVHDVEKKEMTRNPHGPFTTSTLQQDAARKLHFSSKQTMVLAQQLYEGIGLEKNESVGLITYMRTDSLNLSEEAITRTQQFLTDTYGAPYSHPRRYKTKSKSAQEAHEAVRPTDPARTPESVQSYLTPQQFRLYDLIWRRFTASQMPSAVFDATGINVAANDYMFRATGSILKFDGFLKVYPTKFEDNELPSVKKGQKLELQELKPEQHFTQPPPRFNEASLIKILEKEGIGRPSTYAPIISTIQARNYVNKDKSRYFHPTEIGMMVNDLLVEHFPEVVDVTFTSTMEDELDDIAAGKAKWVPVIRDFYDPFAKRLASKYDEVQKETVTQQEKTGQKCDKCGTGEMVVKMGRYGKFVACSNFPECKNILKAAKAPVETTGEKCDKCGEGEMLIRTGRFGKFMACSKYPKCRNTKKILADGQPPEPKKEEKEEPEEET